MRDVVFIVSNNVARTELQYALRSLEMVPHGRVFMLGGNPDWTANTIHLPFRGGEKWQNLTDKFRYLASLEDLSDEFIYTEDDYFILRPVADIPNYVHPQKLEDRFARKKLHRTRPSPSWGQSNQSTFDILRNAGVEEPLSYDVHIPMVVEKALIPAHLDPGRVALRYRTLVGNLSPRPPVKVKRDVKVATRPQLEKVLAQDLGFLSSSDRTFVKAGVRDHLHGLFPDPCRYEKEYYMESPIIEEAPEVVEEKPSPARVKKQKIVARRVRRTKPNLVQYESGEWVKEDADNC